MALEYFKYNTGYTNTLVARSNISFAPLVPPFKEIHIDYFIPEIQTLYLYRESGGNIIPNSQENIDNYLEAIAPPPTLNDYVIYNEFTGYTNITAPAQFVNVIGDTMTGSLHTISNFTAGGLVSGSSVCGGVWVHSPIICGDSCLQSALVCSTGVIKGTILTGSTCAISPITIGTSCVCSPVILGSTRMCSPVILGSTSVSSPILSASTCLCSIGTTRLIGATTAASTLNVSGVTKFVSSVCLLNPPTLTGTSSYTMFWNPDSKRIAVYKVTGGTTNYYYKECATTCCTTSATCIKYLGYTGSTMPSGVYQVDFTEQVGQSNSNATVYGAFKINNVLQGSDFLLKMNQAGFTFTNTLSRDISLPAGTNCFDMYYWAGGGTACATFASVRIRKI